ncbi:MAG: dsDNA nuclease domain-containing protein [Pseudomonadota bacterium]
MKDDAAANPVAQKTWPSIDDIAPIEEGGPEARKGFNYQDEVAVSFLLEMIENVLLLKVHFETHDDLLPVRHDPILEAVVAEYVQVKAGEPDKLWSVADLCARTGKKVGTSIFEKSLARDQHKEVSRFRIITMRQVAQAVEPLTYKCGSEERKLAKAAMDALHADFSERMKGVVSDKGNGCAYWLDNCVWEIRHSLTSMREANANRLLRMSIAAGRPLLFEQLDNLLDELRLWAKEAGAAKWVPDKAKKIVTRPQILAWWTNRLDDLAAQSSVQAGVKLTEKLEAISSPDDVVALAIDLRREYAATTRAPRYMESDEGTQLVNRVKSEAASLRSKYLAGELNVNGTGFHALCLATMDQINAQVGTTAVDHAAFLKGCLYDITDRCLLRFELPK